MNEARTHRAALRTRAGTTVAASLLLGTRPEPGQHILWEDSEYVVIAIDRWEHIDDKLTAVLLVEEVRKP